MGTLIDHLHFTHYKTSNTIARMARMTLPPDDPSRRVLSIFTFGAIFVNTQAMYMLIGSDHALHRATPFKNFEHLSKLVPEEMPDIQQWPALRALIYDDEFEALPAKLREAPFYADGRLLMKALREFMHEQQGIVDDYYCNDFESTFEIAQTTQIAMQRLLKASNYKYHEVIQQNFSEEILHQYCHKENGTFQKFKPFKVDRLAIMAFIVTGWHRHVGYVGDYYNDPELAAMSWKEGERWARPRQHMIMSVINVFTSTAQPKLAEDYSFLFEGIAKGQELAQAWRNFLTNFAKIGEEIDRRNAKRSIPNINMHPSIVESAVSK